MTSNSFKKGFTMMILKSLKRFLNVTKKSSLMMALKKFLNDNAKKVPKTLHNNDTKTVLKISTMMVLKSLKRFLDDVIKKFFNDRTKEIPQ